MFFIWLWNGSFSITFEKNIFRTQFSIYGFFAVLKKSCTDRWKFIFWWKTVLFEVSLTSKIADGSASWIEIGKNSTDQQNLSFRTDRTKITILYGFCAVQEKSCTAVHQFAHLWWWFCFFKNWEVIIKQKNLVYNGIFCAATRFLWAKKKVQKGHIIWPFWTTFLPKF